MIRIENEEIVGWEHAVRGMRNPMNSWEKSDSLKCDELGCAYCQNDCIENDFINWRYLDMDYCIGEDDLDLAKRLVKAGTDHSKFMRMLVVYCDITAPMYWWKEFDTYKVGTVRNSCSTMHKIHSKQIEIDDFSVEHLSDESLDYLENSIDYLNEYREKFVKDKNKSDWWQIIQLLPSSYNQKSTVMLNYQVLKNMYHSRKDHKLTEWRDFCKWIEELPYSELITGNELGKVEGE